MIVPILGALVCASLIVVRLQSAITSKDETQQTAPLIAGGIVVISLVLYKILKPKNVVAKIED